MELNDFYNGLKNKTIKIIGGSHVTNPILRDVEDFVKHHQEMIRKYTEEAKTKKVYKKDEPTAQRMLEHYKFSADIQPGRYIFGMSAAYCWNCGENLQIILLEGGKEVGLITSTDYWNLQKESGEKFDFVLTKKHLKKCCATKMVKEKCLTATIDVPTGELLFANHFGSVDKFYQNPDKSKSRDINSLLGRSELMSVLSKESIGYGQMGNMSVAVHVKKDGTEVIITTPYGYDSKKDEEYDVAFKGFVNAGSICLDVWRWQCGDKKVLSDGGYKLPPGLKPNKVINHEYKDFILTKVKKGNWEIKHYFDFFRDNEPRNPIYSHLKLIK